MSHFPVTLSGNHCTKTSRDSREGWQKEKSQGQLWGLGHWRHKSSPRRKKNLNFAALLDVKLETRLSPRTQIKEGGSVTASAAYLKWKKRRWKSYHLHICLATGYIVINTVGIPSSQLKLTSSQQKLHRRTQLRVSAVRRNFWRQNAAA